MMNQAFRRYNDASTRNYSDKRLLNTSANRNTWAPSSVFRYSVVSVHTSTRFFLITLISYQPTHLIMKTTALAALVSLTTAEYIWPDKYDQIEDVFTLQGGFNKKGFIDPIQSCGFGQNQPGRQNTAEWVRTAYHDMSTADVDAGTGGLDASIMFETERGENKGDAMNNTLAHFQNYYTSRTTAADMLALAVVGSMAVCNGYEIPFRVGRVDATEAGRKGVPEPQQDLSSHIASFAKQGFSQSEMIELVACGHSLGGVHASNFPELTSQTVQHFEQSDSFEKFDNAVVTEFLDTNTTNPLVVAANDTMNSDKRIFASDGNKTMHALADATHFQERCQDVLARMIDTVPKDVVLSEPINPIDVKPYINLLALNHNGTIDFSGYIRVRYGKGTDRPDVNDIAVHLSYKNRAGNAVNETIQTTRPVWSDGIGSGFNGANFVYFEWTAEIDADAGISGFNAFVTTKSTGDVVEHDNGGNGFPVQDTVLYQLEQSCSSYSAAEGGKLNIVAAVRTDAVSGTKLDLHFSKKVPRQGVIIPGLETQIESFKESEKTLSGYRFFDIQDMSINAASLSTDFDVVLSGGEKDVNVGFLESNGLINRDCVAL
ncbi:unnamed protein product [Periconia digitata]|uniref:Peroxidase n=1 Tax=Periconia digitata TaxID=1303443 RepID=A0A9W4UC47_9PLEO|nr:unnamed protein product [Periconia digitata]